MGLRVDFQAKLEEILGSRNVYFQPPPNIQMEFPCITYKRDIIDTDYANNNPYSFNIRYQVTYISRSPESPIVERLAMMPLSNYERFYTSNGLNHDVFIIYF